jgi:hypothetical protein|tara:strand:- start:389 stop:565 length:177 start_codon:yes stop_codon:yes gene_type:complete
MNGIFLIIIATVGIGIYYLVKYIQANGVFNLMVGGFVFISIILLTGLTMYASKQKIVG